MISQVAADTMVLDLETLTSLYNSLYDELDLPPVYRARGAELATACREFLRAYDAKTPNDLR